MFCRDHRYFARHNDCTHCQCIRDHQSSLCCLDTPHMNGRSSCRWNFQVGMLKTLSNQLCKHLIRHDRSTHLNIGLSLYILSIYCCHKVVWCYCNDHHLGSQHIFFVVYCRMSYFPGSVHQSSNLLHRILQDNLDLLHNWMRMYT